MLVTDNVEEADELLEAWDDACNALGIPHLLVDGTCLGLYRDGKYIPNDTDIDTRVLCGRKIWEQLKKGLEKRGIRQGPNPRGFAFRKSGGGGILLTIQRSEKAGSVIYEDGSHRSVMPLDRLFDTVTYRGRTYNVPHPVELYLEVRYGKDWRTPYPEWDKSLTLD